MLGRRNQLDRFRPSIQRVDFLVVPDVLIYGDTLRSPELRHEIPLTIPDGFLYIERNGRRHVAISALEVPRVREVDSLHVHSWDELGWEELLAQGVGREELYLHVAERACQATGLKEAVVPASFPLELGDHLRAAGVELTPDREFFAARRRVKNEAELAGIRRAQRAAEAAMDAARDLFRRAEADGGALVVDGQPLTSERVKQAIGDVFTEHDVSADEMIVSSGPQSAVGHELGSGPIAPSVPIVIDLWPKDRETGCHADMTRTYCVGEPPEELVEYHRLVKRALDEAIAALRAGASGHELFRGTCELFQEHGYKTLLNKDMGETLEEGFFHGLGHGVGLEVHEEPGMGLAQGASLVAGDVVTIEPGLYRPGFGGCRLEDLLLVTEDGCENLTDYPYDLGP
jgi:Xaa-Pro aminopeptidase